MNSPSFRRGMRVCIQAGRHRGKYGTIGGSEWDEDSRTYSRYVLLDAEDGEDGEEGEIELFNVKKLRPLNEGEYFMEQLDALKKPSEARIRELLLNPVDLTIHPAVRRKMPKRPIRTGELLHIQDMPDNLAGAL